MRIDLHLHSHVSDGHMAPADVSRAAHAAGLSMVALTDHDTAAGVEEAVAAAADLPLRVIPGIEISTRLGEHELHILGYFIDPLAEGIIAHQEASLVRRVRRMERMVERLCELGIQITFDEVAEAAGPARSIGRPHLARALLAGGHTRYYGEAFERYISDRGPAFVAEPFPSPADAIEIIHGAGGTAVWAHPPLELFAELLPDFLAWGLDGVECYRPNNAPEDVLMLQRATRELGLVPTGGSDWHGPHRASLGDFFVAPEYLPEFLDIAELA
jgi:predicted metal-dependent phosphoesterase TrpH